MINTQKENLERKIELRGHICNSSVLYNKNFILENGGYNEMLEHSEDHELWIRLLKKGNFIHLNDWLIFMRIRDNSLSKKVNNRPISQIHVFNGSDNPMTEKRINTLKSIREYLYRRKFKLRVKYFGWKLLNYKKHVGLTKKIQELDQNEVL
jgi:hypothetical protein